MPSCCNTLTHTHTCCHVPHILRPLLAGESGLGKTTFINNLTSSFKVSNSNPVQDGSATTLSQFQADPDGLRTVLAPMDIPESSRRLMISVQVSRKGCEGVRKGSSPIY
jgi:septin family protein